MVNEIILNNCCKRGITNISKSLRTVFFWGNLSFILLTFLFCNHVTGQKLVINELVRENSKHAANDDRFYPWVEFFNTDTTALEMSQYLIKIDSSDAFQLPAAILQPGGFFTVWLTGQDNNVEAGLPLTLGSASKEIFLLSAPNFGVIDKVNLSVSPFPDESIARSPDGTGDFILMGHTKVSLNAPNKTPGPWTKHANNTAFSPRDSSPNACIVHNDSVWVFSGYQFTGEEWASFSDVYKSGDGSSWQLVDEEPPFHPYSSFVSFKGKIWAIGSTSYNSSDGKTWKEISTNVPLYEGMRLTVFEDAIWAIKYGTVYRSEDGKTWDIILENAPWGFRDWPGFLSFDGQLWIFGGGINYLAGLDYYFNDVWASKDGKIWELINEDAPWPGRYWFSSGVYNDKIWLMGGWSAFDVADEKYGNKSDIWVTDNGEQWTQIYSDAPWKERHAPFTFNFKDRFWVSSGYGHGGVTRLYNDVWSTSGKIFFAQPDSDITTTTAWNSKPDGSGFSPSAFHDDQQQFFLKNGVSHVRDTLRISGRGSSLILGDQEQLIITEGGYLEAQAHLAKDVSLEIKNKSLIEFETIPERITYDMAVNRFPVDFAKFENLTLRNVINPVFVNDSIKVNGLFSLENSRLLDSTRIKINLMNDMVLDTFSMMRSDGIRLAFAGKKSQEIKHSGKQEIMIGALRVNIDSGDLKSDAALRSKQTFFGTGRIVCKDQPFRSEKLIGSSVASYVVTSPKSFLETSFGPDLKVIPIGTQDFYTPTTVRMGFFNTTGAVRLYTEQFDSWSGDTVNVIWNIYTHPEDRALYTIDFSWYPVFEDDSSNMDTVLIFNPFVLQNGISNDFYYTKNLNSIQNYKTFLPANFAVARSRPEEKASVEKDIQIFPNPCTEVLHVLINKNYENRKISVINDLGQRIQLLSEAVPLGERIDTTDFPPGVYLLEILSQDLKPVHIRFIKN